MAALTDAERMQAQKLYAPPPAATPPGDSLVPVPTFTLRYNQKNISADVAPYVLGITYTDYLEGQSDEIEIQFEDSDGRWRAAWYPTMGDTLSLEIGYQGEPLLPCGSFEIDELEIAAPPSTVMVRGLATGIRRPQRTRIGKAYENTTLAAIADTVAKRLHLTRVGTIQPIQIDRVTQYQENDVEFLTRLAGEYGYSFKVVGEKLVFTELADRRSQAAVMTLTPPDVTSYRIRDKIKAVYQDAKVRYHDPKTRRLTSVDVVAQQPDDGSTSADSLKLSSRAPNATVARRKGQAALDQSNLQQTQATIVLVGTTRLVAGNTLELAEFGRPSGKYLIDQARHRIERGSGYTTELELKKVDKVTPKDPK